MYRKNIVGMLVLGLPGAISPDVLLFASLWITLTVPEVVGTKNLVISTIPAGPKQHR